MPTRLLACCIAACLAFAAGPAGAQDSHGGPVASLLGAEAGPVYPTRFTAEEEAEISRRLRDMPCLLERREHPVVHSYIRGYMLRYRDKSEAILGRVPAFFPLFEAELRRAGLPEDLKYLAVVESALDPTALSRSGAGGLWQFMPGTGQMYGLAVNRSVDERCDPAKATRAAVQFLKDEYARFGDWALVLAAYNGGPGRVRRAMRRSGQRDFWSLRKYLPRETRNYVPAFIAATYLHRYGAYHGLGARKLPLDELLAAELPCPLGVSLDELAQVTGLDRDLVRTLNPHARRGSIPPSARATCRVPERLRGRVASYLQVRADGGDPGYVAEVRARPIVSGGDPFRGDAAYTASEHELSAAKTASTLASELGVSSYHLAVWNPGLQPHTRGPRTVRAFEPTSRVQARFEARERPQFARLDARASSQLARTPPVLPRSLGQRLPNDTYRLQRYETPLEVWQRHARAMTWQEFVRWNAPSAGTAPVAGSLLHIRR